MIGNWGATGFLQSVTVSTQALVTCSNPAGQFSAVAITGALGVGTSMNGMQHTANACFPSGTSIPGIGPATAYLLAVTISIIGDY